MSNHQKYRLPSISDLFSSPKLRSLANHWNPATVLGLAKNVLDEVAAEAKNAASEHRMPDITELSERIAAKLKSAPPLRKVPSVNATGILLPMKAGKTMLPLKALDRMMAALGGELAASQNGDADDDSEMAASADMAPDDLTQKDLTQKSSPTRKRKSVVEMICALTGAADALVVDGHAGALMLAVCTQLNEKKQDVVASVTDFYETVNGYRVDDILHQLRCRLHCVGTVNRVTLDDYAKMLFDETAIVYCSNGADACFCEQRNVPDIASLAEISRKSGVPLVFDAEWGTFHSTNDYGLAGIPTYRELIRQGVNLLVFPCGGLNGCDFSVANGDDRVFGEPQHSRSPVMIAGDKSLIRQIRESSLYPMFLPGIHELAALEAVLELSLTRENAENEIPIWQLLSTSCENLKLRAERMAMQLAANSGVTNAVANSCSAVLTPLRPRYTMPSWQVLLTHATKTGVEMLEALANHPTGIAVSLVPDQPHQIAINLRTVFAKHDMSIIEACSEFFG